MAASCCFSSSWYLRFIASASSVYSFTSVLVSGVSFCCISARTPKSEGGISDATDGEREGPKSNMESEGRAEIFTVLSVVDCASLDKSEPSNCSNAAAASSMSGSLSCRLCGAVEAIRASSASTLEVVAGECASKSDSSLLSVSSPRRSLARSVGYASTTV